MSDVSEATLTERYCAQPGGVDVHHSGDDGREVIVRFDGATAYSAELADRDVVVELDEPTARRLAEQLGEILTRAGAVDASHVIARDGAAPLTFAGQLLATQSSRGDGALEHRWHNIDVYLTRGGKWIGRVQYSTRWEGEYSHTAAQVFDDARGLADWLAKLDPTAHVVGFPPAPHYTARQQKMIAEIRDGYARAVGWLLAEITPAAEVID